MSSRNSLLHFRDLRWWFTCPRCGLTVQVDPMLPHVRWMVGPLCRQLGTSRRSFERVVAGSLGLAPKEWLRQLRICAALRLLRQDIGVKQVATDLGFRHAGDFSDEFKFWLGVSPTGWRSSESRRGDNRSGS